jgi:hypothetical protein
MLNSAEMGQEQATSNSFWAPAGQKLWTYDRGELKALVGIYRQLLSYGKIVITLLCFFHEENVSCFFMKEMFLVVLLFIAFKNN